MTYLSEDTRRRVRRRAGNRCEYCLSHQDYVLGRLQIYKVKRGIRQADAGETMSHEEARERLKYWLE